MSSEFKHHTGEITMNFIMWLVVGAIVGKVTSLLMGAREGLLLDIIAGIVGAFVAGFVLTPLLGISTINQNNFSFPAILVAVAGAVILLVILNLFRRRGYRLCCRVFTLCPALSGFHYQLVIFTWKY
jgi:uncharacterized membrane protein YeaQ/YmgE (transglycosylase-associated protein family)